MGLFLALAPIADAAPRKSTYTIRDGGLRRQFNIHPSDGTAQERDVKSRKGSSRILTRRIRVRADSEASAQNAAKVVGAIFAGPIMVAPGWYLLRVTDRLDAPDTAEALQKQPGIEQADPLLARQQQKRFTPNDPLFSRQWHLSNTGQAKGKPGIDINAPAAWDAATGNGSTIAILDDGVDGLHPDLAVNFDAPSSYDFNDDDTNPAPDPENGDEHGHSCAGLAAALGNNATGITGVAYEADLAGIRLIAKPTDDLQEAEAFAWKNNDIDIKSNSWGPIDFPNLEGPGPLALAAIQDAVKTGRGGLGTIFVWAGGNGRREGDNSNYDGYANLPETVAIGAIGDNGKVADYSEPGANLVASTPSSSKKRQEIVATDLQGFDGYNSGGRQELDDVDYTSTFGGTSASCPIAAGVIALMLEANPLLGWRDVQEILISTARKNDPSNSDWSVNTAGFHFNHRYGAGLIDASAAVALSSTWNNLVTRVTIDQQDVGLDLRIPDNKNSGITRELTFTNTDFRVEHAVLRVDIEHAERGDLDIRLISPGGMVSRLMNVRRDPGADVSGWRFMSVRHWGEQAAGKWKIQISDRRNNTAGRLLGLQLELFGTSTAAVIEAAGSAIISESFLPSNGAIEDGETVGVVFDLKNTGSVSALSLTGALQASGGITNPTGSVSWGNLAPAGPAKSGTFFFQTNGDCGSSLFATITLNDGATSLGSVDFELPVGAIGENTFHFPNFIDLLDGNGKSSPYPATINVSGLTGVVRSVRVRLNGFGHEFPSDMDIALVGPDGQACMIMSDLGDVGEVAGVDIEFDDNAQTAPQQYGTLSSGTFRPRNAGGGRDFFSSPGPSKTKSRLSIFNGTQPNGDWRLFLFDDTGGGSGEITGGWSLILETATCP